MANSALDDIINNFKSGFHNIMNGPQKVISPLAAGDNLDEPYKMRYAQDQMNHNTVTMQNPGPKTYGENQGHVNIPQSFANAPDQNQMHALQMVRAAHPENKMSDAQVISYYNKYGDDLIKGPEYAAVASKIGRKPALGAAISVTPNPAPLFKAPVTPTALPTAPTITRPEFLKGYVMRTPREYVGLIANSAQEAGIATNLLSAVLATESMGFNPDVINGKISSPVGAQGIGQFMPSTAQGIGINPLDPVQAVPATAKMLATYIKRYGNVPTALAAYNAGPGNVHKYGGVPPFKETQDYIKNILNESKTTYTQ